MDPKLVSAIKKLGLDTEHRKVNQDLPRLQSALGFPVPEWYRYFVEETSLLGGELEGGIREVDVVNFPPVWALCNEIESGEGMGEIARVGGFPFGTCAIGTGWVYSISNQGDITSPVMRLHNPSEDGLEISSNIVEFVSSIAGMC